MLLRKVGTEQPFGLQFSSGNSNKKGGRCLMHQPPFGSPYWVQTRTKLANLRTFTHEIYGGIVTGFKNITSYLVKQGEPIPLKLLRKTHVTVGAVRPKKHPISGELINYGQVPFGFRDVNGTLHPNPLEQFVLQSIRKMRDEGASLNHIANYLTTSGVPTKNGGRWQSNTVNGILRRK